MKQVLMKRGAAFLEEVPAPAPKPGYTLVQVSHSCISTGTELSGMKEGKAPLWKQALKHPEKVKKAFMMLKTEGFLKTKNTVQKKMQSGSTAGYSAAGTIVSTTKRVACAGTQYANHAETISVPKNLIVPIPENLTSAEASTVALGAIALQGVRRAQPTLGETFVVIGLGFLGQITAQLLQANGCRVFGIDPDSNRLKMAGKFGIASTLSDHQQVDGVIITAATQSNEVVSQAFQFCRKKGRVVLVGDVGLNLKRSDFYQKELDFLISSSYGPGRYDDRYEEKGFDYPIGYVRWTEHRNMEEYLKLLSEKKVDISPFIQSVFPINLATQAYEFLQKEEPKPFLALLSYPQTENIKRVIFNSTFSKPASKDQLQVGLIGAGDFAKEIHLPNLQSLKEYSLRAIASRSGQNALATAKQFEAKYATTDASELIKDPEIDLIFITTRHNLHASLALQSLKENKHVFIEKPLCLNQKELEQILNFYEKTTDAPVLLTGFNRRFSKYIRAIHNLVQKRLNPLVINYRMNAGFIPEENWVHQEEGGGRNIGEACHIYDLFTYLTNSKFSSLSVHSIKTKTNDNFIASISFQDGSIATLTYTSLGSKSYPKEQLEVFVDGKTLFMNNYRSLNFPKIESQLFEKGQKEELETFAKTLKSGGSWPIPLWQQAQAMEIAFQVEQHLAK